MEFNETEILFALWSLQRDRNKGVPLNSERAARYRIQADRCLEIAVRYDLPAERAGYEYRCAALMIESELHETQAAA